MLRANWRDYATCVGFDPETFFPVSNRKSKMYRDSVRDAKAICSRCPVRQECLSAGGCNAYGVWGGKPQEERFPRRVKWD
jgi:WhiB family redox-sensing transcriptional regulator